MNNNGRLSCLKFHTFSLRCLVTLLLLAKAPPALAADDPEPVGATTSLPPSSSESVPSSEPSATAGNDESPARPLPFSVTGALTLQRGVGVYGVGQMQFLATENLGGGLGVVFALPGDMDLRLGVNAGYYFSSTLLRMDSAWRWRISRSTSSHKALQVHAGAGLVPRSGTDKQQQVLLHGALRFISTTLYGPAVAPEFGLDLGAELEISYLTDLPGRSRLSGFTTPQWRVGMFGAIGAHFVLGGHWFVSPGVDLFLESRVGFGFTTVTHAFPLPMGTFRAGASFAF